MPPTFSFQGWQHLRRNSLRSGGLGAFLSPTAHAPLPRPLALNLDLGLRPGWESVRLLGVRVGSHPPLA